MNLMLEKLISSRKFLQKSILLLLVLVACVSAQAQITVTGTVTDQNDDPMIGLTVSVKNTTLGVTTDVDGTYSIKVPDSKSILVFSYIGFEPQEQVVGTRKLINVKLKEDTKMLEEVVVVGYGVQKKVNLSGAVQAVSNKEISSRPIANVNSGLQGLVANLNISTKSGRADDAPGLNIRGYTSVNGGDAFILVDNVPVTPAELARINPSDIENISVLKDASSAAIYGARAAFGVVLVTTKRAKSDKLSVNFSGNYALRDRGKTPEVVTDIYTVMQMKNAARAPLSAIYSQAELDYAKQISENPSLAGVIVNPTDQNKWSYFGQTDWQSEAFKNSAATYTANLDISKRDDKFSYFVSAGYYQQDGMLKMGNDIMKRYNFRGNADFKLTDRWKLATNIAYTNSNYDSPTFLDGYFFWNINRTASTNVPRNPDGTWTSAGAGTLGAISEGGRRLDRTNETQVSASTEFDIIKNVWKINADMNFRRANLNRDSHNLKVPYRTGPNQAIQYSLGDRGNSTNAIFKTWENRYDVYNIYSNFTKTFNEKHYFNAMIGYNRELTDVRTYTAQKNDLISQILPEMNLATGNMDTKNTHHQLALEGYFGRLNYIFNEKYIVEFNGRYDGSSRYPKGDRWGFFPSGSLAWLVVNEGFFKGVSEQLKISNLKLRGSYGALGNQVFINKGWGKIPDEQDYYPYIPLIKVDQRENLGHVLDGKNPIYLQQPGLVASSLTWETVRTINGGIDLGLLRNRFNLSFDLYTRYTEDMLTQSRQLPAVIGVKPPKMNAADLKTKGWELTLNWQDKFNLANSPFEYSVSFMIADSKSTITKYDNPTKHLNDYYVGQRIGEIWGFTNDGFFQSEAELAMLDQKAVGTDDQNYKFYVGDTRFKDLNGDKKIDFGDNTVDKPGDRKIIGNSEARFPYSFEFNASWKNFDVRMFFQGVGKRDWYPDAASIYFWGIYAQPWTNVTKKNMDHWTPERRDAYFPRVKAYTAEDRNEELGAPQTKYLQDASYLRMKNLTVGYTLPKNLLSKIKLSQLRVYFSAENLFTVKHLDVDLDPEIISSYGGFDSGAYPMQKVYSIGATLSF